MAEKLVREITSMDEDFAKWYTDIVLKAELVDYSSVKGCVVFRPYSYAIWENIQKRMDAEFKRTGHENVYMPMFITESLLQKEKDHVEGFAPEVAWVTQGGSEPLQEKLCVRPTSETLFCEHFSHIIHSHRDLPKLYNQWCSVVRWEKTTRPFLRSREFLWQEGHSVHATPEEAIAETERMLNVYADFIENDLAIPVVKGRKTESDKFAGAEATYCIETLMHDGVALQAATSHYFGDGFARSFNIQFTDKNNKLQYAYGTSWGSTTRLIGAIIMVHGDNNGLKLPPRVAPVQAVIIPVAQHKPGVLDAATQLKARLEKTGVRVKLDDSEQSPGWKFAEYEMKGVPLRIEIGPRDLENGCCVIARRDNGEKTVVSLETLEETVDGLLETVQHAMYEAAKQRRDAMTFTATSLEELRKITSEKQGFIRMMWCGDEHCEKAIKDEYGVGSRCIPLEQEHLGDTCPYCGKPAKYMVYWGKAY